MKTHHHVFLFIGALLSLLVPCPARFGYVLILVIAVDLLLVLGTAMNIAVEKLKMQELSPLLMMTFLVFCTILIKQFIILYSPVIAMTLSFVLYLIPVSSILIGQTVTVEDRNWQEYCIGNLWVSGVFTLTCLLFGLVRECIAFGSISLPVRNGIWVIPLKYSQLVAPSGFWGSIPGAFIILALVLAFMSLVHRRFNIIRSKE